MTRISALVVNQWLQPEWDQTVFHPVPPRGEPEQHFYLFTISAYQLKKLTGVYRRDPDMPPAEDIGIQRRHDESRSAEILRYIQHGFPLSRIDRKKLVNPLEESSLRMPGWLPTAVLVNILTQRDQRGPKERRVRTEHLVKVHPNGTTAEIELPRGFEDEDWQPAIHPIEVIDGQHRLWAFEEPEDEEWDEEFKEKIGQLEVPVVAFHGLDATWRAYLFYTINQLPKRIDTSMVFDLYPLLRTQEWLLRFEGPNIYRQTRAQDLVILLWGHPESPWKGRINRLGGSRTKGEVTQAAFINSLMASFIKSYYGGPRAPIGGLFGSPKGQHETQLNWTREQQAAFLIRVWQAIQRAVENSKAKWAMVLLRRHQNNRHTLFSGPETLLATDQGVRGYLAVLNDTLWVAYENSDVVLDSWDWVRRAKHDDNAAVSDALASLDTSLQDALALVDRIAAPLASFDWRIASALSANDPQFARQASYRGGSGYKTLRRELLIHLANEADQGVSAYASTVMGLLRYEPEDE
jgi:DGQHR domain-containing protein